MTGWDPWFRRLRDIALLTAGLRWGEGLMANPDQADPWKVGMILVCLGFPVASWADERWRRWAERLPLPSSSESSDTGDSRAVGPGGR